MGGRDEGYELPQGYTLVESMSEPARVICPDGTELPLTLFRQIADDLDDVDSDARYVAVEPRAERALSWMDSDSAVLDQALQRRRKNREALMDWLWGALKEDVDFGRIKADGKPSLWQPGAEKICGYLDLTPSFPDNQQYVLRAADGQRVGDVVLRCFLHDAAGKMVGEGIGAREADQTPKLNDRIKMAEKSALIDAVKRCAGLSEVFTQDQAEEGAGAAIDQQARNYLMAKAQALFGEERADAVLMSLARRRFGFDDGDWHLIPAIRLMDAIRSLEEKHDEGFEPEED